MDKLLSYSTAELFPNIVLNTQQIESFRKMASAVRNYRFYDIVVPISKFENVNAEQINDIYAGINRGGIKLTEQDLLASTCSAIIYSRGSIKSLISYDELYANAKSYYDNMNSKEVLKVDFSDECLNLFEVLTGLHSVLYTRYRQFMPTVKNSQRCRHDIAFEMYEATYNKFDYYEPNIGEYIDKIVKSFDILRSIELELYSDSLPIIKQQLNISETNTKIVINYFFRLVDNLDLSSAVSATRRCLAYNEICSLIKSKKGVKNINKEQFKLKNGLTLMRRGVNDLGTVQGGKIMHLIHPTDDDFRSLIKYVMNMLLHEVVVSPKKRRMVNKLYCLLLNSYFTTEVPMRLLEGDKNVEHIVPFCSRYNFGGDKNRMDIDRLGNLTILDDQTNKKRSNQRITKELIEELNLKHYMYPGEKEYNSIVNDQCNILSIDNYNKMCEWRERSYIDCFIKSLR